MDQLLHVKEKDKDLLSKKFGVVDAHEDKYVDEKSKHSICTRTLS